MLDLLRNNLEKPGERISVKRSNMHGVIGASEGSISYPKTILAFIIPCLNIHPLLRDVYAGTAFFSLRFPSLMLLKVFIVL